MWDAFFIIASIFISVNYGIFVLFFLQIQRNYLVGDLILFILTFRSLLYVVVYDFTTLGSEAWVIVD